MTSRHFAMMLKTYAADLQYAQRLVASFDLHNVDGIQLFCIVPEQDQHLFAPLASDTVTMLTEESFLKYFTSEAVHDIRPGYINQEIVKLAFWELGLADNYFCVDSEAVFIRDFGFSDFIAPDGFPYSVLVEDRELIVEPEYFERYWRSREVNHRAIAETLSWQDPIIRTCHGHQTFSSIVLQDFKNQFLSPRGWSYLDALKVAPYEFTWYNLWLQKSEAIPIHQREPFVKVFHHERQHLEYIVRGVDTEDIARAYLAVLVNSNFSRNLGPVDPTSSKPEILARYLSYSELRTLILAKLHQSLRRLGGKTS